MNLRLIFRASVIFVTILSLFIVLASPAFGATLVVTNLASLGPGTLRQALSDNLTLGGGNTIIFSNNVTGTITLQGGLTVSAPVTILGPGTNVLAINGNNLTRIFSVTAGPVLISGLTIRNGRIVESDGNQMQNGGDAVGGGIFNQSTLTLSNCLVLSNSVVGGMGGERAQGSVGRGGHAYGGGIYNTGGTLSLIKTVLRGNQCTGGRGGFAQMNAAGAGGDGFGGAIYTSAGTVQITSCSLADNHANGGLGGGIGGGTSPGPGGHGYGGGLYSVSPLTIFNSTLQGSSAVGGNAGDGTASAAGNGYGGGIYSISTLAVLTSTVVSNSANGGGTDLGGGIFSGSDSGVTNSTIAYNHADRGGGLHGTVSAANTILAGNTATNGPDGNGTINSQDYNLIQNTNGLTVAGTTTHNLTGQDPLLGPLQDNGGPTLTMSLLPGSPAIDQGKSFGAFADQRGLPRPWDLPSITNAVGGDGNDIGAFEFLPAPQLNIQRADNANIILHWITDAADFRLESVTNLPATNNWLEITNARITIGNQVYVTNSAAGTSRFYRLRLPPAPLPPN